MSKICKKIDISQSYVDPIDISKVTIFAFDQRQSMAFRMAINHDKADALKELGYGE
jgi:hypothetical protein